MFLKMIIGHYTYPSLKGINVDNPVQAAGAARGKKRSNRNSEGVQPTSGVEEKSVRLPRVPLRSTRGYPHLSPSGIEV